MKQLKPFLAASVLLVTAVSLVCFSKSAYYAEKKESLSFFLHSAALSADLRLGEIYVRGRNRTSYEDLRNVLKIERGMPLTAIDIQKARESIQRLPWVKTVRIERRLPHILYISMTERTPIAVWQNKGEYRPIDADGQPVEMPVKKLNDLPLIVGIGSPEKTPELLRFLEQEPELRKRVKAAVYISTRRWDIILDHIEKGITVRLPEKAPAAAWGRLANLDRTQKLLSRKVTLIDLRQPDKLVVRLEDDATRRKKKKSNKNADKPSETKTP